MHKLTISIVIIAIFAIFPIEKVQGVAPVVNEVPSAYTSPIQMKSYVILINDIASVTALDKAQWQKVAHCETQGNWKAHEGERYQGGLGITPHNWVEYGGFFFAPHSYEATPTEQIFVAKRIQHGLPVPDQNGSCQGW